MKLRTIDPRFVAAAALAVGLAGCMNTSTAAYQPPPDYEVVPGPVSPYPRAAVVAPSHLTDATGRSVYMFVRDQRGPSKCFDRCAQVWPPLVEGQAPLAEPVDNALIGEAPRAGGPDQLTYNDMPLYYYVKDRAPGDTTGQGVRDEFGTWYLVSRDGRPLTTGGGSSGY